MDFLLDNLIAIGITVICIAFVFCCFCISNPKNKLHSMANQGSSLLVTLGILFTFLGISIALASFDISNIDKAIPKLLSGLKTAFYTSVVGLVLSIVFRGIKPFLSKDSSAGDSHAVLVGINENILSLNTSTLAVKDALIGEGDASLATQIGKLRLDFKEFAKKIAEDGSKALIEALEEVIKDFNTKINEQFGENFKRLNEAVGKLLEWQIVHKKQVEELTEIFNEAKKGIVEAQKSIEKIEQSSSKIPEQMSKIQEVFELVDKRVEELYSGLSSLAAMRKQAETAVPFMQKQFETMTEDFKSTAEDFKKMAGDFKSSVTKQLNDIKDTQSEFQYNNKQELTKITDNFTETTTGIAKMIETSTKKTNDILNQSTQKLDQIIKDQLNSIQTTQSEFQDNNKQELTKITDNFTETTTGIAKMIETSTKKTNDILNQSINDLHDKMSGVILESTNKTNNILNKSIDSLDDSMREELQRCLNIMGNNLTAITEKKINLYRELEKSYERHIEYMKNQLDKR